MAANFHPSGMLDARASYNNTFFTMSSAKSSKTNNGGISNGKKDYFEERQRDGI